MDTNIRSGIRDRHDYRDHAEISETTHERSHKGADSLHVAPIGSGSYHDAAIEQARLDAIEARCNPYA